MTKKQFNTKKAVKQWEFKIKVYNVLMTHKAPAPKEGLHSVSDADYFYQAVKKGHPDTELDLGSFLKKTIEEADTFQGIRAKLIFLFNGLEGSDQEEVFESFLNNWDDFDRNTGEIFNEHVGWTPADKVILASTARLLRQDILKLIRWLDNNLK